MNHTRLVAISAPAVLFALTALGVIGLLVRGSIESLSSTLAIGILSSLVATMVASFWRFMSAVRSQPSVSAPHFTGLIRVTAKGALTANEWLQLLRTAKAEFYIAGHSLGKWCSPSNRDEFRSHIRRILDSRGRVTLVMLDPASPQIARLQLATSVDYTGRIHTSLRVLGDLCDELEPDSRSRLTIAALEDHPTLSYMVVGNEERLVTATYLASTDSENVACLELDRTSEAAAAIYDDFHKLAEAGVAPTLPPSTSAGQPHTKPARRWRNFFRR